MLQVKRQFQVTFLHSDLFDRIPGIVHAFSTRRAERNDFTLGAVSTNPMVQINRDRFLAAIGAPGWPILKLNQTHSAIVREMIDTEAAGNPVEGDGALTSVRGAMLGIQAADCVPILLADSQARAVGAVHAGWRGTAAGIVRTAIDHFREKFGIDASSLLVCAGPHIGVCCYEVGDDVFQAIGDSASFEQRPSWQKLHLNLGAVIRRQLLDAGVSQDRIDVSSLCTRCRQDLFYSYRGQGKRAGRMLSVIGIAI